MKERNEVLGGQPEFNHGSGYLKEVSTLLPGKMDEAAWGRKRGKCLSRDKGKGFR